MSIYSSIKVITMLLIPTWFIKDLISDSFKGRTSLAKSSSPSESTNIQVDIVFDADPRSALS